MASVRKIGNWNKVRALCDNLDKEMALAKKQCLMRWGLKAEAVAKGHISAQDLGWKPLKAATVSAKVKKGYSENILMMTTSYFQSITSFVKDDTAFAGVKKGSKNREGGDLISIAAVHEYGNSKTPARPLWQPTFKETMEWTVKTNNPADILMKNLEAKYR